MKTIIHLMLLIVFATASFAQQSVTKQTSIGTDYLKKSKSQKKTAWILLGGGATLLITSIVIPKGEITGASTIYTIPTGGYNYKNDGIKAAIGLAGVASIAGSIPLFLASGKNKRKAMTASIFINMEKAPVLQQAMISNQLFPAFGFKINL